MRNLKRRFERFTAIALAVLMVVTTVDLSTFAVSAAGEGSGTYCEHHTEHTPECGYTEGIEGSPCTHEHGEECYSEVTVCVHGHDESCGYVEGVEDSCTHICSLVNGCIISTLNCTHEHDENCGYVQAQEGTPCSFVCNVCEAEASDEDDEDAVCICEDKCTADAVNEECPVCFAENADLNNCIGEVEEMQSIITAWSFVDEIGYIDLETNTLALPGANAENVALKEDIISLLPASIKASINDAEETLALSGWECANYPQEGAYAGTYTFSATLPEGYTLGEEVSELTVNVELGGAGLYDEEQTTGDFTVTGGTYGQDYTYDSAARLLTIQSSKEITIENVNSSTSTTDRIEVADGVSANITLAGVNIDVSSQNDKAAFKIADNSTGNVTITLADGKTNTLKSGNNCAGLQKNGEYSETLGKLTITGTGTLTATGGESGAGIGGGFEGNGSNIEISGGKVTATGGKYAAGIGGGDGCDGSYITISGGEVTATGGDSGAGIGGGFEGSGSYITISGGEVTATGGEYGAGIGGGFEGNGSNIEISGGKVTATGGDDGAGIGSGDSGSGSYITISGGEVTATGGEEAAGIGGGWNGNGSNIEISGGEVTATGGEKAAGIGGGFKGNGSNIEISGGSVKAVAGEKYEYDGTTYFPAAIGQGVQYDGNTGVYSNGAEVTPTYGADNVYLTDNVYLLELDVDGTSDVTINGKAYPTKHFDENKVYVYLPAGEHTIVKDGGAGTTAYYAKNADNKLEAVAIVTAFTITGTDLVYGTDYTYTGGVLTILSDKAMTIENVNPSTPTTDRIEVADGVSANITLAGVNIDVSSQNGTAAFKIADNSTGDVTIILADNSENTLKSGMDCAGLQKNGEYSETLGKLTITGTGSLTATGGEDGAGIGGGERCDGSNITISGGVVTATGGKYAAGIGGGYIGSGSNIKISGGTVTATCSSNGAGIGGGSGGSGSNIKISGGTVTATGGESAAGIGGGYIGSGSNIEISGGTVTATGGKYGAGIGGGFRGSGSNIEISGGVVIANGGGGGDYGGAGIGGGGTTGSSTGSYITISGGTVTATGGSNGAGIGGGGGGSSSNIEISGGTVKANTIGCTPTDGTANATPVYLLELDVDSTSAVTINGKAYPTKHIDENRLYVYLPAGNYTVANGNSQKIYTIADNGDVSEVVVGTAFTITGTDLVYGTDYTYPADTGVLTILSPKAVTIANADPSTSTTDRIEVADGVSANITLAGVNIDVSSQSDTAAFKIADDSTGNVTITLADGTTNTLKSGDNCAGLQKNGEYSETLGKLTITGTGSLTATSGEYGAGIGGGYSGSGSYITISGGTVTATGGYEGAGIGGGSYGSGSNIEISGGVVTATGGKSGAGIGGGYNGSGSYITISGGTVTATGGNYGAGIGGYSGSADNIKISGGSVKADTIGCTPTDGTANATPVYLLELDVDGTSAVTANGKAYPTKHFDENKVYIYLPAKTAQAPNEVTVGNETTKYCYINAKWLKVVDSPEADDYTEFTYDGTEKTYTLAESDYYTITGNKQTNAGTYTVTVALNDKDNTVWNDGSTEDNEYSFVIYKADSVLETVPTPKTGLIYKGEGQNLISAGTATGGTMQYSLNCVSWSPDIPSATDAGEYTVYYKIAGNENYNGSEADSFTVNIAKKQLTVTEVAATSRDYIANDKTVNITGVTLSGKQGTDNVSVEITGLKGTLSSANAGTYTSVTLPTLTLTGDDAENYVLVQPTSAVATNVTINKLNPTITVDETEYYKTFGDADFTLDITDDNPEANVTYSSNAENVVTVSNGTVTIKGVGSATITVSMGASTNYNAAVDKIITVNVAKATYSVETINKSYLYARSNADSINLAELLPEDCGTVNYASVTSNGALSFISEPKVTNGILAYTLESGAADDTGNIIVDVETQNYEDITITVNVTLIDQIPVNVDGEVELNSNILTYGETLSGLTFKSVDFVDNAGNEVAGTLAWKEPSATPNAGTTSATWVFTPNNAEYASVEGTVAITVNKATPNVTAVPTVADRVYNPSVVLADSDLTGGTVKGVDGNSLAGGWSWQSTNVVPEVGNSGYVAVFTPVDTDNYKIVEENIEVKVNPAQITVSGAVGADKVYDRTNKVSIESITLDGILGADEVSVDLAELYGAVSSADAGEYVKVTLPELTLTGEDAHNYVINSGEVALDSSVTISKASDAPNKPETSMAVPFSNATVSDVKLPEGWAWSDNYKDNALVVGEAYKAVAEYVAADKNNYTNNTVEISITRQEDEWKPASITYQTHVQKDGWTGESTDGEVSGTTGESKRLESIVLAINTDADVDIQYTTHVQSYGWMPWVSGGTVSGTTGESKRLEAIMIRLIGQDAENYDVYYRVHAQNYGWLDWAKNGEVAGTAGLSKRLEGIQVIVVKKGEAINEKLGGIESGSDKAFVTITGNSPVYDGTTTTYPQPEIQGADTPTVAYRTHVQSYGWMSYKYNGGMSGTQGQSKRLEGIQIDITNTDLAGDIIYTTHVQSDGWQDELDEKTTWTRNGSVAGTYGQSKRLEGICIDLTDELKENYDIYYRVHIQSYGWLGWAKNGEEAGSEGLSKRLEGIQIVLVKKGEAAPANNYGGITSTSDKAFVK